MAHGKILSERRLDNTIQQISTKPPFVGAKGKRARITAMRHHQADGIVPGNEQPLRQFRRPHSYRLRLAS
jgi:hypothetical protein